MPIAVLNMSMLGKLTTSSGSAFHCTLARRKLSTYSSPLPYAVGTRNNNGRAWMIKRLVVWLYIIREGHCDHVNNLVAMSLLKGVIT